MDAVNPEYRVRPDSEGARCVLREWRIAEQPPLMFHQPTRLMLKIYRDPAGDAPRPGIMELRARLNHVRGGMACRALIWPAWDPARSTRFRL